MLGLFLIALCYFFYKEAKKLYLNKKYMSHKMAFILIFITIWLIIPTLRKAYYDNMVDDLCAKDGGVKVYETVTLPKERFNQWGQFEVPDIDYIKPGDQYYRTYAKAFSKLP